MSRRACVAVACALALACGCSVNRKTDGLRCSTQDQCTPMGRVCEMGYCVIDPGFQPDGSLQLDAAVCPPECDSCNLAAHSCRISGRGGNVTCPIGWSCEIQCASPGACTMISCDSASSCSITCAIDQACGPITCGAGACDVTCVANAGGPACGALTCGTGKCSETCTGSGACGDLSCASSCNCNATCLPSGACATMTCPTVAGNKYCAMGGAAGAACDSSVFAQCRKCP